MINKNGANEDYKHWNIGRRIELNGDKNTIKICLLRRKRSTDGRLIKKKAHL